MKKIFIAFAAAACLLGSCSDDDNTTGNSALNEISITTNEVSVGPDGGTKEITVTSSGDWRLSGVCDWVHPSAVSGKDGQTVTFTIDPNDTDFDRESTFKFFAGEAVTTFKIVSEQGYSLKLLSERDVIISKDKGVVEIKLHTNIEELTPTFSDGGAEWITFDRRADAFGRAVLYFNVVANTDFDNRSSVITISGLNLSVDVTVTQSQVDALNIKQNSYALEPEGGEITIEFDTNVDYIVDIPAKDASWIHRVEKSNATRGLTAHSETFRIDPAKTIRSGQIIIKKAGGVSATVSVAQQGSEHVYVTIPDANFRKWLIDNNYVVAAGDTRCELTLDGLEATVMDCSSNQIYSIEGITAFTKLTTLKCKGNFVTSFLLGDMKITSLEIGSSRVKNVNVVVAGKSLTSLNASSNYMTTLDVSECPALNTLNISYCSYLSTLYLKTGLTPTIEDTYAGNYKIEYK